MLIATLTGFIAHVLDMFNGRAPLPIWPVWVVVLVISIWGLRTVLGAPLRAKQRAEEEAAKDAERSRRLLYEIERDDSLMQMLRDANTFDAAKTVYDSADDGSEIKRLAWAKMQRLI